MCDTSDQIDGVRENQLMGCLESLMSPNCGLSTSCSNLFPNFLEFFGKYYALVGLHQSWLSDRLKFRLTAGDQDHALHLNLQVADWLYIPTLVHIS